MAIKRTILLFFCLIGLDSFARMPAVELSYEDTITVLRSETLAYILRAFQLGKVVDSAKGIAQLLEGLEHFEKDIAQARLKSQQFRYRAVCANRPRNVRSKIEQCKKVGCDGSRAECLKKAIQDLRVILRPLTEDLLLGYESEGKKVDGIAFVLMDIAQQPESKKELNELAVALKRMLEVLDALEKAIKITPGEQS